MLAAAGAVGPLTFIAAWAVLGAAANDYDPTRKAISRLAAIGAPTRPWMTAGLVVLGAGMALYGLALRPRPIWVLPVANGLTAWAVAGLALGGSVDTAHGVAALLGYVTVSAIPAAVGGGRPVPVAATLVSGALLLASVLLDRDGLFQRAGLTVAQLWIVFSAVRLVRGPAPMWSSTTPRARGPAGRRP